MSQVTQNPVLSQNPVAWVVNEKFRLTFCSDIHMFSSSGRSIASSPSPNYSAIPLKTFTVVPAITRISRDKKARHSPTSCCSNLQKVASLRSLPGPPCDYTKDLKNATTKCKLECYVCQVGVLSGVAIVPRSEERLTGRIKAMQ